ncbi:AEC family transporter [Pseudomonas viridiflava]|uniref:AEC family transporter n=1 Tax=Pseudomonas viridiflava TaxID=33069 RepID=A0ABU7NEA1_PSEVI|nr:AEC family transporter [Pseudomonas viridiflava]MEE4043264.1 AEC family transporter [Pseudomonas viridiflava]MEE4060577.1 AEC family transporter [Pseudomonas viridiflava]MEE4170231.1 AEC family transporter [Pseudomonas viridiflava]
MAVLQAILPVFLLIVLGYGLGKRKTLTVESTKALSVLAFKLFLPMVLFTGMVKAPLHDGLDLRVLAAYFVPALIVFVLINLVMHRSGSTSTPFGLTASFSNNILIGIPLVVGVFGDQGLVLLFTVIAVHSLTLFTFQSLYDSLAGDQPFNTRSLFASLANPLIIGLLLGIVVNLSGLALPEWADHLTTWLAQAALPCALIVLGSNLSSFKLTPSPQALGITVGKLFLMPLLVLLACMLLGIEGLSRGVLVLMAAGPAGVNVLGFARSVPHVQKTSSAICLTTVLSAATLPLWMWLVSLIG